MVVCKNETAFCLDFTIQSLISTLYIVLCYNQNKNNILQTNRYLFICFPKPIDLKQHIVAI